MLVAVSWGLGGLATWLILTAVMEMMDSGFTWSRLMSGLFGFLLFWVALSITMVAL
jgi:hypothetical protein